MCPEIIFKTMRLFLSGTIWAGLVLSAYGQTVAEVASNLMQSVETNGRVGNNSTAEFIFSIGDTNFQKIRVQTCGDRLKEERVFATNNPARMPYVSITEIYSANDFTAFRAGGRADGEHIKNEAEKYAKPMPVLGVAVFSSRYFQGQLLTLQRRRRIEHAI
jgi:hypothetical protein